MVVRWLAQTRPIPRSPDGDKKSFFLPKYKNYQLLLAACCCSVTKWCYSEKGIKNAFLRPKNQISVKIWDKIFTFVYGKGQEGWPIPPGLKVSLTKKTNVYGQADRWGLTPPPYSQLYVIFLVHWTLDYNYICSKTVLSHYKRIPIPLCFFGQNDFPLRGGGIPQFRSGKIPPQNRYFWPKTLI